MEPALIALIVVALLLIVVLAKSLTIVPQAQAKVVERLGRYSRTLTPGLSILVPFVDRVARPSTSASRSSPSRRSR